MFGDRTASNEPVIKTRRKKSFSKDTHSVEDKEEVDMSEFAVTGRCRKSGTSHAVSGESEVLKSENGDKRTRVRVRQR